MVSDGRPELLILNKTQFGYHVATYYYCRFGASRLQITCMGFDTGKPRFHADGVDVKYVAYRGGKVLRYLRLISAFIRAMRGHEGAVFVKYFPGCSVLRYFGSPPMMIVDIRTGSVSENPLRRRWEDRLMQWECHCFRNISVISQALAERLHLPCYKTHILPLGADRVTVPAKRFDRLDLLYVGTLTGRHIEDTVVGFERFLQDYGAGIALTYTIIGDGYNGELEKLRRMVQGRGLSDILHVPGYVQRTRLQDVFSRCNVGVSYVPINDIYDGQPVTKTYEYVFAGMPVIATATAENKKVVERLNGVLISDTPDGFYHGLKEVYTRRHEFDSEKIRRCCPDASWDRIVNRNFVPYIQDICP
jgi:glycosyltransferase involved in cell wall biosynthesis